MADELESIEADAGDGSFEALLKRAAHVSGPAVASLGPQLQSGRHAARRPAADRAPHRRGRDGRRVRGARRATARQRRAQDADRLDAGNVYRLKNEFRSLADVSHANLCALARAVRRRRALVLHDGAGRGRALRSTGCGPQRQARRSAAARGAAAVVCRHRGDSRGGQAAPGPQAEQRARDAGGPRGRARLRARGRSRARRRRADVLDAERERHAGVHGARASGGRAGDRGERLLCARRDVVRGADRAGCRSRGGLHEMLVDKQTRDAAQRECERDVAACAQIWLRCATRCSRAIPARGRIARRCVRSFGAPRASGVVRSPPHAAACPSASCCSAASASSRSCATRTRRRVAGKPVVMFVSGESGMGKSALVAALSRRAARARASGRARGALLRARERAVQGLRQRGR